MEVYLYFCYVKVHKMYKLSLPEYKYTLKKEHGKPYILDTVRKKYVRLTPEEWVRQHIINYLIVHKKYPQSLMQVELGLELYSLTKRADILCYKTDGTPLLLVECKAPEITLNQSVCEQIAHYNIQLKAPLLLITNGIQHIICKIDITNKTYSFLPEMPNYVEILEILSKEKEDKYI